MLNTREGLKVAGVEDQVNAATGKTHDGGWWDQQGDCVDLDTNPLLMTRIRGNEVNIQVTPIQLAPLHGALSCQREQLHEALRLLGRLHETTSLEVTQDEEFR